MGYICEVTLLYLVFRVTMKCQNCNKTTDESKCYTCQETELQKKYLKVMKQVKCKNKKIQKLTLSFLKKSITKLESIITPMVCRYA